jgi:small conductance mechanosensitive channel
VVERGRIEQFEQIMTAYGRDLIFSMVFLIVGLFIVQWLMKRVRGGLAKAFKQSVTAATIANVLHLLLLASVLLGAANEAGLDILPIFRLFMLILLGVIGLVVFLRPYIPTLPFKVGQTVKAAGLLGKVEATTFLNTRIRTFDGKVFFVPNRTILNDIVINYHFTPTRRIAIDIPIRYDQDLVRAKQVLEAVMIADPRVRKTPRPSVWVLDLSNGCVQLGGRCWADNPKYWSTRVDLIEKAKLRFDYEGIVISYPHLGVHPFNASAEDDAFQEKMATGRLPRSPEPVEDEM